MNLDFQLHDKQLEIFNSPKRFKVVVAGRQSGKTHLSAVLCIVNAIQEKNAYGYELKGRDVWYIAPTFNQAKENIWALLKELGQGIIKAIHENTGTITLVNGRRICLKGSDSPETLRGAGLSFLVMDEYATMKPSVWELIVRPTLMKVRGGALFIGTPAGKNHFYELYCAAQDNDDWETWQYSSKENPYLPADEFDSLITDMSESAVRQEIEANFEAGGSGLSSRRVHCLPSPRWESCGAS